MAKDIWEDEEDTEFRDVPDEVVVGSHAPPVHVSPSDAAFLRVSNRPVQRPIQPEPQIHQEDPEVDLIDDDEDDYTSVLSDARLRLEQGRLYEMIMNHDLFQDTDADIQAIKNVQKEIKRFARERMEVMLGMRQTVSSNPSLSTGRDNPVFNDLEIEILKRLASTATSGATESPEANQIAATKYKRNGLATIGGSTTVKKYAPVKVEQRPLPKAQVPVKRKRVDPTEDAILREEGIDRETFEEVTRSTLNKPITQMTQEELIERNRQSVRNRPKLADNPNKMPMATPEQAEMLAAAHAQRVEAGKGMSAIIAKLKTIP